MKIVVTFPRTKEDQKSEVYEVMAIPHEGESITTDGNDCWNVVSVIHVMNPLHAKSIAAYVRVR